jgi:hypothetical protein
MPRPHVRPVELVAMSPNRAAAATGFRLEQSSTTIRSGDLRVHPFDLKRPVQKEYHREYWGLSSGFGLTLCFSHSPESVQERPKWPPDCNL